MASRDGLIDGTKGWWIEDIDGEGMRDRKGLFNRSQFCGSITFWYGSGSRNGTLKV